MWNRVYGIDLGTGTIKICTQNGKKYISEKNMIAIRDNEDILAIGDAAYEMYEKAPQNVEVGCPMVGGVIGDITNTELLLAGLLKKISPLTVKYGVIYIAAPTDISEVEKRAFFAVVKGAALHARKVRIVDKSIADAVYLGVDLEEERGSMIVNIGAETTELSVVTGSRTIFSKTLEIGGKTLDESICTIVRRRYNLNIGMKTAEALKKDLAYIAGGEVRQKEVFGVNMVAGLPRTAEISSAVVNDAIIENMDTIIDRIKSTLERTPPELVKDIREGGIYLTGGSAQIPNLAYYIELETGVKINKTENPTNSTILGLQKIMQTKELQSITYSLKDMAKHRYR